MNKYERDLNMNICEQCNNHYYKNSKNINHINKNYNEFFCSRECEDIHISALLDKSENMKDWYDYMPLEPIDIDYETE